MKYLSLKGWLNRLSNEAKKKVLPHHYYSVEFWQAYHKLEKIIDEIESLDVKLPQ